MESIPTLQIIETMREYPEGINALDLYQEFPELEKRFDEFFRELVDLQRRKLVFNDASMWIVTKIGNKYYYNATNQVETKMETAALQRSKLVYETKVAKWMSKTYWWTFIMAITALIISLIALFIK